MQLRGVVYHQIILNANFELFLFLRKSKTAFYFKVRFCYIWIAVSIVYCRGCLRSLSS